MKKTVGQPNNYRNPYIGIKYFILLLLIFISQYSDVSYNGTNRYYGINSLKSEYIWNMQSCRENNNTKNL